VSESRLLGFFDAKGQEVSGERKKLGSGEIHDMVTYSSTDIMLLTRSNQNVKGHVTCLESVKCIQSSGSKTSRVEKVWEINVRSGRII
jgi:hypothetical protein